MLAVGVEHLRVSLTFPVCHRAVLGVVGCSRHLFPDTTRGYATDAGTATRSRDVVRARLLGIMARGSVLRLKRLPEGGLTAAPTEAHHCLVRSAVHMRHHPRPHQQAGLRVTHLSFQRGDNVQRPANNT